MTMSKNLWAFLIILVGLSACKPEEESDTFWNEIETSDFYKPFVFVFSNTEIATCAEHAQPKLEQIWNGEATGISPNNVNGVMFFPSVLDNQYSFIAEEIKFLFDANGNNTLETWPAYFNNMFCYNIDSTGWKEAIKPQQTEIPKIKLGLNFGENNSEIRVYVKGEYQSSASNHSLAAYVYRKEELGYHETLEGKELTTIKNKVIGSMTPTFGKSLDNGNPGDEIREVLSYNLGSESKNNLGVVVVIYQLSGSKPTQVINSARIDNF